MGDGCHWWAKHWGGVEVTNQLHDSGWPKIIQPQAHTANPVTCHSHLQTRGFRCTKFSLVLVPNTHTCIDSEQLNDGRSTCAELLLDSHPCTNEVPYLLSFSGGTECRMYPPSTGPNRPLALIKKEMFHVQRKTRNQPLHLCSFMCMHCLLWNPV